MSTATTTRTIIFRLPTDVTCMRLARPAAGTTVYVSKRRNGSFDVRLPGTLYTQNVTAADLQF